MQRSVLLLSPRNTPASSHPLSHRDSLYTSFSRVFKFTGIFIAQEEVRAVWTKSFLSIFRKREKKNVRTLILCGAHPWNWNFINSFNRRCLAPIHVPRVLLWSSGCADFKGAASMNDSFPMMTSTICDAEISTEVSMLTSQPGKTKTPLALSPKAAQLNN